MGNTGIYDLLLHKRDVSYTVQDLYKWTQKGGYKFVGHALPENRLPLSINEKINTNELNKKPFKAEASRQEAVCEIMAGFITIHYIFVSKVNHPEASLRSGGNVVHAHGSPAGFRHIMNEGQDHVQHQTKYFVFGKLVRSKININSSNAY